MGTNDLRVKIPLRFKEQLERRFPDPATIPEGVNRIEVACPLCGEYPGCKRCPFHRFKSKAQSQGCGNWLPFVGTPPGLPFGFEWAVNEVRWDACIRADMFAWLSEFRQRAAELIEWVPDVEAK